MLVSWEDNFDVVYDRNQFWCRAVFCPSAGSERTCGCFALLRVSVCPGRGGPRSRALAAGDGWGMGRVAWFRAPQNFTGVPHSGTGSRCEPPFPGGWAGPASCPSRRLPAPSAPPLCHASVCLPPIVPSSASHDPSQPLLVPHPRIVAFPWAHRVSWHDLRQCVRPPDGTVLPHTEPSGFMSPGPTLEAFTYQRRQSPSCPVQGGHRGSPGARALSAGLLTALFSPVCCPLGSRSHLDPRPLSWVPWIFFSLVRAFEILSPQAALEIQSPCFLLSEMEVSTVLLSLHLTVSSRMVSALDVPSAFLSLRSRAGQMSRQVGSPLPVWPCCSEVINVSSHIVSRPLLPPGLSFLYFIIDF